MDLTPAHVVRTFVETEPYTSTFRAAPSGLRRWIGLLGFQLTAVRRTVYGSWCGGGRRTSTEIVSMAHHQKPSRY
jgi:hypothetical protein